MTRSNKRLYSSRLGIVLSSALVDADLNLLTKSYVENRRRRVSAGWAVRKSTSLLYNTLPGLYLRQDLGIVRIVVTQEFSVFDGKTIAPERDMADCDIFAF
jgi:hypothetical protein